jgi:hypothetical protein
MSNGLAKLPETNWRRSYHETIADEIESLRALRSDPLCRAYREVNGRVKSVVDMTDGEIEEAARRVAEKTLNRALHQANARGKAA